MKILFCNPKNSQGTTHSRKGMYPPLGILSITTVLKEALDDGIEITVRDEDVENVELDSLGSFDVVGLYSTTFNYYNCIKYASAAKRVGCLTILGGPHSTVLSENILRNQDCFDYILKYEAEIPVLKLIQYLLDRNKIDLKDIPNLVHRDGEKVVANPHFHENSLEDLPIPSRDFIPFELYIENFKKIYPDKDQIRPGSIYSSKGCSWRDKTGGCVFCARLEKGLRFRDVTQIWDEIKILQETRHVNSIWDISDDNLNNREWFQNFVKSRPKSCQDLSFFIYSRVNFITPGMIEYFKELNVEEIFLGVESGDNQILKNTFKGQTARASLDAARLLKKNDIKYFPSFILGLPGESESSLMNTYNLCRQMADLGGIDRLGCTILQPIPGSPAFDMLAGEPEIGHKLKSADDLDLSDLERRWVERFTNVDYETAIEFRKKISELIEGAMVFGCSAGKLR